MQKYKYLIKNIGLLTVSKFGSKILSFILIPLYTNLLTTAEYGTYDIYSTTVSLLIPILTIQVVDSVVRFSLEVDIDKTHVFSIGFKRVGFSCVIVAIFITINWITGFVHILAEYPMCFFLMYSTEIAYSLLSQFCRGIEKINELAVSGIINSLTMLGFNIIFLVIMNMGLRGYFYATVIAYVIPSIFLIIRIRVWKYVNWSCDKALKDEMYSYSKPMVFNNLAWWVNNASDRYIVTWLCGTAANGIYSISYKIPSLLNVFQEIFSQAWTLSAVKEFNANDSKFYTNVYEIYNVAMVLTCSGLIIFDKYIAKLIFAQEFYSAWIYAPFLMISVLFGALSGLIGGIFSAAKRTDVFAKTTILGASVNTVLNLTLVYFCGAIGAAIATLVSYILVWGARLHETKKIIKFSINLKIDIFAYTLLIIQAVVLFLNISMIWQNTILIILFFIIAIIYRMTIKKMIKKFIEKAR